MTATTIKQAAYKHRRILNSLGGQMVLLVSSIILIAMMTNAYVQFRDEVATTEQMLKVRAHSLGQMLASISVDALLVYDVVTLNKYIENITSQTQVVHAVIVDDQGKAFTTYLNTDNVYIHSAMNDNVDVNSANILDLLEKNNELVTYKMPVKFNDVMLAQTIIVLDKSEFVAASAQKFEEKILITILIGLFVGSGIYIAFKRMILIPIQKLSDSANQIANLEFDHELDIKGDSELTDLSENFNRMSDNIEMLIADRDSALQDLEFLNIDLERRVQERTVELQALNVEIAHQAMHDPLTGLPNRTLLVERLKQNIDLARRNNRRVAFIMLDLNNFKEVNDTLGHPEGDRLLQDVANRLPSALRQSDTVGRLGGDEFGIVLPDVDQAKAIEVAKKLLSSLESSFHLDEQTLTVGASIGIALFPDHGEDDASLIRHADVAMYEAKRNKGDPCLYDPDADHYTTMRLALMADLHNAVKHNQILLYYQPQVRLVSKKVSAVEALLRWHHPEHGNVSPEDFIPMAESSDLIRLISNWVLEKAITQLAVWQSQGIDLCIAINLSARDLLNPALAGTIETLCSKHGVSPSMLKIEITESVIMSHPDKIIDMLDQPAMSKVNYAIDDFGTGYSSLSYLKKLPIREVKIDKSFVLDMVDDADDASIVRSVIELAHSLGHIVVAEGVENEQVLTQLVQLGCDAVQGFYFSPAVEAGNVLAVIENIEKDLRAANYSCAL
jgi:diguanylate cyclase (GGDEF)-like protein